MTSRKAGDRTAQRAIFLDVLRSTANVSRAARAAGLPTSSLYRQRAQSQAFAADWDAAISEAIDTVEEELIRRARDGVEKPVFYGGKQIGTMRIQGVVEDHDVDDPPASPAAGQCWIVGASPSGAWAGRAGQVAGWTTGGWRFVLPRAGMTFWHIAAGCAIRHNGSAWIVGEVTGSMLRIDGIKVVGAQQLAIADPSGGTTVDVETRAAMGQVLAVLRSHGLIAM